MIINCISYIRINPNYSLCNNKSEQSELNYYYIIEKGHLEYGIDGETYTIGKEECICTQALAANAKESFYVKSKERAYIFRFPVDKFKSIVNDFANKLQEERLSILKNVYLFKHLDKKTMSELANLASIKTYKKRKTVIHEGTKPEYIFVVVDGEIRCGKNDHLTRKLSKNETFGDIWIFTQMPSINSYVVEAQSTVLRIKITYFAQLFETNPILTLIFSILKSVVQSSQVISKYFYEGNIKNLFDIFELKYYYKDCVLTKKSKKVLILLAGRLYKKITIANKQSDGRSKGYVLEDDLDIHGELYGDEVLASHDQVLPFEIFADEAVVFEANWYDILKITKSYNIKRFSMYTIINYFRNHYYFTGLNELNLFHLAENFKYGKFKKGDKIIKDGPYSDKFYTIISGRVGIVINNIEVKTLKDGQSFGDIMSASSDYSQKATYYANTVVEVIYLEVDSYKEIIDLGIIRNITSSLNLKDITLTLDKLYYVKDLGQGSFGKVYLVHDTKKFYAMKTAEIKKMIQNKDSAQFYLNEKKILSSMNYPFIAQLINTYKTKEYIFFLMELVSGNTLRYFLNTKTKSDFRKIEEITFIGAILGNILNYLQKNRIIHRDLKPDNIMIDKKGYLKAIDFGVAKFLAGKDSTHTMVGTIHYMAPEVISGKNYSFAVDFWAVGVILFEVFYGKQPFGFGSKEPQSVYKEIIKSQIVLPSDQKYENVNSLIKGLLYKNQFKRIRTFDKYKAQRLFEFFNFDSLNKKEMTSPLKVAPIISDKEGNFQNYFVQFSQFMQNNVFYSSNDLSEMNFNNNHEADFLNEF